VEVHIYGSIHRKGVNRVVIPDSAVSDQTIGAQLKVIASSLGIECEAVK
jgi:hypothetical protein